MSEEILSKEEADALLEIVSEEGAAEGGPRGDAFGAGHAGGALLLDFSGPPRLAASDLAALRRVGVGWARGLPGALSELLRAEVRASVARVEAANSVSVLSRTEGSAWIHILGAPPLHSRVLLVLESRLALSAVDRLLGAASSEAGEPRPLTAIEAKIAARLVERLLETLSEAFHALAPLRFSSVHAETDTCAAATVFQPGEPLVEIELAFEGALAGAVRLAVPVGPLRAHLDGADGLEPPSGPGWVREHLEAVRLDVVAVLSETELRMADLLTLRPDDVIELGRRVGSPVSVQIEGVSKFEATVGQVGGRMAVRLVREAGEAGPARAGAGEEAAA